MGFMSMSISGDFIDPGAKERRQLEQKKNDALERVKVLGPENQQLKTELESKKQEIDRLAQEKDNAQSQIGTLETKKKQCETDLDLETQKASQDKEIGQGRVKALEKTITSLESSMSSITSSAKVISDMNARLSKDLESCSKHEKPACSSTQDVQYKTQLSQLLNHFGFDSDDYGGVDSAFAAALSNRRVA